jgi:hypothetical protein
MSDTFDVDAFFAALSNDATDYEQLEASRFEDALNYASGDLSRGERYLLSRLLLDLAPLLRSAVDAFDSGEEFRLFRALRLLRAAALALTRPAAAEAINLPAVIEQLDKLDVHHDFGDPYPSH